MNSSETVTPGVNRLSSPSESDEVIVTRVLRGAKEDYAILVERYKNMVLSLIGRQVHNPHTAEELAQETFIKAFSGLSSFRGEARFSSWLIRIALNQVNSYFSSRQYKEFLKTAPVDCKQAAETAVTAGKHDEAHLMLRFKVALSLLAPRLREVLCLVALEGKNYEEAAAVLKIPVGTVRSRLNHARSEIHAHFLENEIF